MLFMATKTFHKVWLKISAAIIAGFAPFLFLGTMPALNEPARWGLDLLSWPLDGFPSYQSQEMWFLSALTGGFLLGWGVMVWCLSIWVYDDAPEGVQKTLLVSTLSWFVLDSAGSITSGNGSNALWNIIVLLLIVGPMWRPAKD